MINSTIHPNQGSPGTVLSPLVFYLCGFHIRQIQFQVFDVENLMFNLQTKEIYVKALLDFPYKTSHFDKFQTFS